MDKINEFRSSQIMYDIFGYLLPGFFFLCLLIIDFDFGAILQFYFDHDHSLEKLTHGAINYKMNYLFKFLTWNTDTDFKFTTGFILLLFCYLLGNIIAAISSQVLEVWINSKILGFPSENLLYIGKRNLVQKIFKSYTKPFDEQFIKEFTTKFKDRFGEITEKKAFFWLCFGEVAKHHPVAYNRVLHFLSLYGFSRNVSACFFIYAISRFALSCFTHIEASKYNYVILSIFVAIGCMMFKNYLKLFYRQCAELYYHFYAATDTTKNENTNTTI